MNSLVSVLAEGLSNIYFEMLPASAVQAAKRCMLDAMGNMIYGRYSESGEMVLRHLQRFLKTEEDMLVQIPGGEFFTPGDAAFAGAVMARVSDLDDGHRYAMGHPGSFLVPIVSAYGQAKHQTGEEMLTALVVGYETYVRVGMSINPSSYKERGFESTSVSGAVASAATLSKLYVLRQQEIKNALGIAATYAGGLIEYQNDGTMCKQLSGAWAFQSGLQAVQLALSGYTGPEKIFEGPKGFCQAFSNTPNSQIITDKLGIEYKICQVYFKTHACMRGLHAAVDAALELRRRWRESLADIKLICIRTTSFVGRLSNPHPDNVIAAQNSLEFVISSALLYGDLSSERILKDYLSQSEVWDLMEKISLVIDEKIAKYVQKHPSHWGAIQITLIQEDGTEDSEFVTLPKGEPENPFTWEQLCKKFSILTADTPYAPYCDRLCEQLEHFEKVRSLKTLFTPWEH